MNTFHTTVMRFLSNINYQEQPMEMQQTLKTKNAFPGDIFCIICPQLLYVLNISK